MNDSELDTLLCQPLPERDAGEFSVALMEAVARHQARPARILSWLMVAVLFVVVAAASVFGALAASHGAFGPQSLVVPAALTLLTLLLSFAVLQSARE
ncbi:MAG TPA: hypothetical protein VNU97_14055 [Rhizomicrobium sp.]|jgi:hypothetical protein|nr:hypothetical protein [Rhizomicrobium sp.]